MHWKESGWINSPTVGGHYQGRIQDFKLGGGGGGGAHLKKIAPSGGRRENVWGISCENSRFYAKKSRLQNLPPTPNLQF